MVLEVPELQCPLTTMSCSNHPTELSNRPSHRLPRCSSLRTIPESQPKNRLHQRGLHQSEDKLLTPPWAPDERVACLSGRLQSGPGIQGSRNPPRCWDVSCAGCGSHRHGSWCVGCANHKNGSRCRTLQPHRAAMCDVTTASVRKCAPWHRVGAACSISTPCLCRPWLYQPPTGATAVNRLWQPRWLQRRDGILPWLQHAGNSGVSDMGPPWLHYAGNNGVRRVVQ